MRKLIPERFQTVFLAGLVSIVAAAVYLPSVNAPFVYDDNHSIRDNPAVLGGVHLVKYFTDPSSFSVNPNMRMYRPLVTLSCSLTYRIAGFRMAAWHGFNILFHAINAVLLFIIALRILGSRRSASVAALLWAIHPLGSEAVIYQSARSNLLAATAVLAGFYLYASGEESSWRRALSAAVYAIGLLCKESAIVLPFLIFWYDANRDRRRNIKWLKYLPYAAVMAAYFVLRMALLKLETFYISTPVRPVWENLLTQSGSVMLYFKEALWPAGLSIEHNLGGVKAFAPLHVPLWRSPIFAMPLIVAMALAAILLRGRAVAWSFGIAWWFISLAPESSIIPLVQVANERRVYLPLMGLALVVGAVIGKILSRIEVRGATSIIVICFTILTLQREVEWRTPESLWIAAIKGAPHSVVALHGLASVKLNERGDAAGAEPLYRRIIKLDPTYYGARLGMGRLLMKKGDFAEAERQLRTAMQLDPKADAPWIDLSYLYLQKRLTAQAEEAARYAIRLNDRAAQAWNNLGMALGEQTRPQEALAAFDRAVSLDPDYAIGHLNRGYALLQLGRRDEARAEYRKAIHLNSSLTQARKALESLNR